MHQIQAFLPIDYVLALWRRKWVVMIISSIALALAIMAILKLPVTYRSSGLILVEQQEIPTQWVQSTVASFAEDRIEAINQRVLTRANLKRIIRKFNLFPEKIGSKALDELVELARENFSIESVVAEKRGGGGGGKKPQATIAFRIAYEDSSAEAARDVVKELVSLYLEENLSARTQAATDTRKFLEAEADRIEVQLANIEQRISDFKEENIGALPDQLTSNTQSFERVEQLIADVNQSLDAIKERKIVLESSIDSAQRLLYTTGSTTVAEVSASEQRLSDLNTEYLNLKSRYSASHPDLVRLRREIVLLESQQYSGGGDASQEELQFLEAELKAAKNRYTVEHPEVIRLEREIRLWVSNNPSRPAVSSVPSTPADDTVLIRLRNDLDTANSEAVTLRERRKGLYLKLDTLEQRIAKTPAIERTYRALVRDHENIQDKYIDIREKQNSARVAESLEAEQKGERFTLIEAPRLSTKPYSPDYKKLLVLVIGLAGGAGLGSAFILELMDGRIRNSRFVGTLTGVPVLATIGYIKNEQDSSLKLRKILLVCLSIVLLLVAVLYFLSTMNFSLNGLDTSKIRDLI